jgi:hypothetical protein
MLVRACVFVSVLSITACGGKVPSAEPSGTGNPADVAQVRLFDSLGTDLTLHTGLIDNDSLLVEVRMYAAAGHRLTEIAGGVELALQFTPDTLATSIPVTGQPLRRIVIPLSPSGTAGSQAATLHFPGNGSNKSFGPFHVQVQPSPHGGVEQMRLFDDHNTDLTQHIPLTAGDTMRLEVRLYGPQGSQLSAAQANAEIAFRFEPTSLASAAAVPGLPLWKDITSSAPTLTEGSLFVSVLFLADSVTKTYGPIQVLIH